MGTRVMVGPRRKRWGTAEEFLLSGAVTRYGSRNWDTVAAELQSRIPRPHLYTPQACKAKYEEAMGHYTSTHDWYEELREARIAELRRDLEKSDDSIRSLELKMRSLKRKRKGNYGSDKKSKAPGPDDKDAVPADTVTQDTSWSPEQETTVKINSKSAGLGKKGKGGALTKQRGKRRRKDSSADTKEGSIGESDNLRSNAVISKKSSTRHRDEIQPVDDTLLAIFNSISEQREAFAFRHRLDGQKRVRYRSVIRQHVDFETIRAKLSTGSINSAEGLFRELLLLATNAVVFYSKRTKEFKAGVGLRDMVLKAYRGHLPADQPASSASTSFPVESPLCNPPGKPRSARPRPSRNAARAASPKVQSSDSLQQPLTRSRTGLKSPDKMKTRGKNLAGKRDKR